MMKNIFKKLALTLAVVLMSTSLALAAITVEAAKSQGLVGEQTDGLLGAVSAPSADVAALVKTTNAKRLATYESIAAKNGTDVEQVKALMGKKLIGAAHAGEYIQSASGEWQKK